ncbi:MAG: lysophospholipid acyltransferase family protein, partial [Bacteroidales bacterium]|nr:lysophospholipid acyltransferase family protein [Bacteroidales bacterium]
LGRSFEQIRRSGMFRIDDQSCEVFNNALLEGRSVVLLLGHCGNWELLTGMAVYMPHSEVDYSQVTCAYKQLHSPLSQELMLLMRRRHMNLEGNLVPSHKFVRYALGHKDENRAYFLISDQYTSTPTCTTTFLGLETGWAGGGEMIARRLHSPVLYIYVDREQRCGYVIKILQICNDASAVEPSEAVRTYSALLESDILARPACWLWSHKRWKNLRGSDYLHNQ